MNLQDVKKLIDLERNGEALKLIEDLNDDFFNEDAITLIKLHFYLLLLENDNLNLLKWISIYKEKPYKNIDTEMFILNIDNYLLELSNKLKTINNTSIKTDNNGVNVELLKSNNVNDQLTFFEQLRHVKDKTQYKADLLNIVKKEVDDKIFFLAFVSLLDIDDVTKIVVLKDGKTTEYNKNDIIMPFSYQDTTGKLLKNYFLSELKDISIGNCAFSILNELVIKLFPNLIKIDQIDALKKYLTNRAYELFGQSKIFDEKETNTIYKDMIESIINANN